MEENLKRILEEFESLKGQFVITESWKIERLVAIGDDDTDYYYITFDGRKFRWNTCVGRIIQLKNKIDHYEEFIRIAKLNHLDQPTIFGQDSSKESEEFKKQIVYLTEPNKFLTEVCWDLN